MKRRGRLRTGHREAGAAEKRLRAGPVGEEKRQASDRPQRGRVVAFGSS